MCTPWAPWVAPCARAHHNNQQPRTDGRTRGWRELNLLGGVQPAYPLYLQLGVETVAIVPPGQMQRRRGAPMAWKPEGPPGLTQAQVMIA